MNNIRKLKKNEKKKTLVGGQGQYFFFLKKIGFQCKIEKIVEFFPIVNLTI
jgi:hypothetical protein